jgi:hypothetical protein
MPSLYHTGVSSNLQTTLTDFLAKNEHSPVAPLMYAESLREDIKDTTGVEPRFYVIKGLYLTCARR